MISLVLCNSKKNELEKMEKHSHNLAAFLSEEEWKFNLFSDDRALENYLAAEPVVDIACIDLSLQDSIRLVEHMRKLNKHAYIILVATTEISPMSYMRPTILAGSLLIRKYSEEQMKEIFDEAFRIYLRSFFSDEEKEEMYVVDTREGRQLIPYSHIYYFEARDKKIVIGCAVDEITCYDTIAGLEDGLPDYFVRCHRSYIINMNKVVKMVLSQGEIILEKDICIPVSRSYKAELKRRYSNSRE